MSVPSPQQAVPAAQLPLPARPLARSLLLSLQSLSGLTDEDRTTGWAAALFTVCTRPSLIAITGDGFGVTPPANGPRTREPVVVVAEYLQKHLAPLLASQQPTEVVAGYQGENPIMAPALPLTFQCVPAGTFKSGVFGLWQSGGKTLSPPCSGWVNGQMWWCKWESRQRYPSVIRFRWCWRQWTGPIPTLLLTRWRSSAHRNSSPSAVCSW